MNSTEESPERTWRPIPATCTGWSPASTTTRTASWAPTNTATTP